MPEPQEPAGDTVDAGDTPGAPDVVDAGGPAAPVPTDPPDPADGAGRARLLAALRRPARTQVIVGILLAVLGFAGVTQIRANGLDDTYAGYREQDLIDVLNGLAGTTQRTRTELDRLQRTRESLTSTTDRRQAALDEAQKQIDDLQVIAGLVPVTGPGIRVTITEQSGTVDVGAMLDLIEQLRTSGAEAIQINGQVRVVAQTSVDDGVGGLLIDGTLVESPFVVDAIGVPATLSGGIDFGLGVRYELQNLGATVDVQQLDSLDITSVRRSGQRRFAQPGS